MPGLRFIHTAPPAGPALLGWALSRALVLIWCRIKKLQSLEQSGSHIVYCLTSEDTRKGGIFTLASLPQDIRTLIIN